LSDCKLWHISLSRLWSVVFSGKVVVVVSVVSVVDVDNAVVDVLTVVSEVVVAGAGSAAGGLI